MTEVRPKIYEILRMFDSPLADRALVASVSHLEPTAQGVVVDILLERARPEGLAALPALYDQLEDDARAKIVANASRLFAPLRSAMRSGKVHIRSAALRIIQKSGNLRLAYLASHAMHDASPRIRSNSADVLLTLAEQHRDRHVETTSMLRDASDDDAEVALAIMRTLELLRQEREFLLAALREALHSYESHHRIEIVEAAMYFAEDMEDSLFLRATARRGKLTHAMIEVFTESMSPGMAAFAYIGQRYNDVRGRIASAIAQCRDRAFMSEFIRLAWLGRDPAIRRALNGIRSLAFLSDELEAVFSLPPDVAVGLPSAILPLGMTDDAKVSLLNHVFLLDNPAAHREATWALTAIKSAASTRALLQVVENDDLDLRRAALREIDRRRLAMSHADNVPKSRPDSWRRLLRSARLSENFNEFWESHDRIDPALAHEAGHHMLTYIPGFATQLRVRMLGRKGGERLQAVHLARCLGVTAHFRSEVYGLAQDTEADVRAEAMTALGQVADATSRRILERALDDDSPTVQAAAILGLDRMRSERRPDLMLRKCNAEDARVRAAAIRVLLRMRQSEGATNLIYMLHDPRPTHRSAALQLIDALKLDAVSARVTELAEHDADHRVALLAAHVLKKLKRSARRPPPATVEGGRA